jgi:hypothetical protein
MFGERKGDSGLSQVPGFQVPDLEGSTQAGTAGVGMFNRQLYWETAGPPAMPTRVDAAKIPFE